MYQKERIEAAKLLTLGNLYEIAYRAHSGTSFSPEVRGCQIVECYSETLDADLIRIKAHDGDCERYKAKFISMLSEWLHAKGRCLSCMITGPANFPTARNEKANRSERNKYEAFSTWRNKALHAITKGPNTDIIKGNKGALEKMEEELHKLETLQVMMKEANKIIRDKHDNKTIRLVEIGWSLERAEEMQHLGRFEGQGFAGFQLTNNGAKIRSRKRDIQYEISRQERYAEGNKSTVINDIEVIENHEDNRLQLKFNGKPEREIIQELKKNAFRWSPKNAAWQRQLTNSAIYAARRLSFLQKEQVE